MIHPMPPAADRQEGEPVAAGDEAPALWHAQHVAERLFARLYDCATDVGEALSGAVGRTVLRDELNALDDRALADIGIAREQIPTVVESYPEATELLERMIDRLRLRPETIAANPGLRQALERSCTTCFTRKQCRRWLRSETGDTAYREFCPNAKALDDLLTAQQTAG